MPVGKFGQQLRNVDRQNKYLRLKKGDTALVRLAGDYAYEGKHIFELTDESGQKKYDIQDCVKVNNNAFCEHCAKHYELIQPMFELKKQQKATSNDEEKARLEVQIKKIQKTARPYEVKVAFYYPALKRAINPGEQPEATIFQTSLMVRRKFDEYLKMGYSLTDYDFKIFCTGELPNYYIVDRVDKEKTQPLSEQEHKLLEEARGWELESLVPGRVGTSPTSTQETTEEVEEEEPKPVNTEVKSENGSDQEVDVDDIPF